MGYFLDRVKDGSVPDELTENPKERNIRTMQDVLADNEREGIETPSVYGKIVDQEKPTRSNTRVDKRINARKIRSSTPLFPNTTIGPAPKTTQPLSAADIWKYGAKRLLETSMESPFSSERRREQAKIRDAAKMALDTMSVKREQGNSPGTLVETRWSGKTYGTDMNQNGRLDTFEVESGSNPFNNFYYTLAKPAATLVKDSLIAGGHAFNDGVYSFLAGVGDYLHNIPRAAAAVIKERDPFAKVELETPFTDSAPIQAIKNNAAAARERASKSAEQFGVVGEFADQIMQSTTQMAPSIIAAYFTAGTSAAGDLSRAGMTALSKAAEMLKLPKHMIPTFVSQAGQSYSDALEQTGDPTRALGYGIVNGYANALIEQGGVQSEIASGNLQSTAGRRAWNFIKDNMLQEGAEEITQNWTEKGLRKMMIDRSAPLVSMNDENAVINPKRDLYAGAVGAAAGGLFGGANMAFQNIGNIQNRTQTDRLQQGLTRANERTSASKNQTRADAENNGSSMPGNERNVAPTGTMMRNVRNVGQGTSMNQAGMETTVDGRTTQEVATNQNASNSQDKSTGVKAGEVTTIYSPYEGEKPVQTDSVDNTPIPVSQESVQNAVSAVEQAKNNKEGISLRSALRKTYERLFDKSGGAKHVPVKNMAFRNEPYVVDVNKNAISKIISDKNLTVEKLSLLDNLNAIIENGKYVGSGNYVQKGNKKKLTVRFDYFETPVRINGKDYIAAFDVEVFPNTNQYRTHKVIEKMDLIALPDADTGPVPAANGNASSPTTSIPENSGNVNGELRNGETVTGVQENNTPGILTSEEEGAIIRYKGGGSYALNDTIREGNQLTESQSKQVQDLNRALERMPRVEGTVYRNIGFLFEDSFNKFIEENSGRTVTYPAFTSASKTPDGYEVETPYQVHMEIESKNGRDLTGIGTEMEEEVLFKTDTTFQIHSAQRNGNIFHLILEEVAENGNQSGHDTRTTEGNRGSIPGNDTVGVGEGSHIELDTVQGRGGTAAEIPKGTSTGNVPGSEPGDTRNRDGRSKEKGADSASERQAIYGNLNESKDRAQQNAGGEQFETRTLDRAARIQEEATRAREAQDPKRKVEQAAEAIGRKVEWYSDQSDPAHANQNGYYKDGVVHINETAQNPYMTVLGHESFHSLNAKDRAAIIQFVKQNTNTDSAAFQRYREERRRAYMAEYQKKGRLFSDWDFWEEYTADNMENFFQDEAFVSKLGRQNKTLAEKLWNTLRNLWEKIKQVISPKQYSIGMNEAGQASGMTDAQFHRMEQMFQKALGHESELGTDGKASIMKRNGEYVINVDRDIFQGANKNDYPKILRQWLDENFEDEQIVSLVDNNVLTLNKKGNKELAYGANSQKLHGSTRVAKNRISQHIDEVARIAKTVNIAPDKQLSTGKNKHGAFAQDGWKYKDFTFKIGDQLYSGRLNVAMNPTGEYVYDITKIKRYPQNETSIENGARIKANTSSDINNISQNQDSVNSSISENGQNDTEKFLVDLESGERGSVVRRKDKAEEAMRKYEETGDPNDLPEQQWANAYYRDAQRRDTFLNNQIDTAEYELENAKTKERREHLQALIDNLRDKQMAAKENLATSKAVVEMVESIATPRNFDLAEIADQLHGIDTNTIKNGNYRFNDIYRNMKRVFKKNFRVVEPLLDQFDAAKGDYARDTVSILAEMNQFIQKQLKIKKGSKESKAVQWIAEGERNPNVRRNKDREALRKMGITDLKNLDPNVRIPYTEQMLVEEFGTKRAEDIKEAAQWFRGKYDELIDEINRTQRLIYPNRPDKLIPKRKDYMRHFREVSEGLAGLRNILDMDNNIDPILVGTSEYTKPKEKWASIKQKRSGKATQEGAIEGFLDYIGQAEYAIHINPYIDRFRGLARDLAQIKSEKNDTSLNGFIGYLNDYAADLAGKSSKLDRAVIDSLGARGRTMMKGLRWFNNRTKANAVLGNLGSVAKQVMNLPNGMALLENPANMIPGIVDVFRGFRDGGKIQEQYKKSNFLTERLKLDRAFGKFDKMGPGKVAQNLLGIADEFGTRVIWNAAYREGVNLQKSRDITDAVKYADNLTRQAVAGRGIGETPLAYKSEMGRLFLPFQIEVNNTWNVLRDVLQTSRYDGKLKTVKNFGDKALRVLLFYLVTWGLNEAMEKLTGSKGSFDPLGDIIDGIFQGAEELPEKSKLEQWQRGGLRAAQNLAGDFIGSRSFGWVASSFMDAVNDDWATKFFNDSIYPSQGVNVPALQSVQKGVKKFGDGDPVGSAAEFATSFLTPWGGKQLDKTIRGLGDYLRGGNYQNNIYKEFSTGKRGDLYYPIEQTPANAIQSAVFGPSSLGENAAYWQTKRLETYAKQAEREFKEDAAEQFTKQVKESNLSTVIKQFYTDETVEPKTASTKVKYKDTEYTLTEKERQQYQETIDREALKLVTELSKSNGFSKLSEEDKVKQLEAAQSYADAVAKNEVLKKKEPGKTIQFFKQDVDNRKKYYSIWDEVEPEDEDKQARRKAINEVSSVVNALSKKSKLTPGVISGLNQYMDKIESRAANAVDKELNRLGLLREENTDTTGDMDVTSSTMGMFEYTDDGQKYEVKVNYADIPKIMQEVEEETYKQMQRLLNNQYRSQKKKTYGQRYNYKNANADQKIKWVNEVRTDVRNYYKDKYARKYGVRKVPNKLKGVR